jgi:hypothetical protein
MERWFGPRAGLDDVEMRKILPLLGFELRPLARPAHSQSVYRLPYVSSLMGEKSCVKYI